MTHVVWLCDRGSNGFVADDAWLGRLVTLGIRCGHCDGVRPDAIGRLDAVVVGRRLRSIVVGFAHLLWNGLILRDDFAARIGHGRLDAICRSVPVTDANGTVLNHHRFYMEREPRAGWRGDADSKVGHCRECGRLLYQPFGKPYLLRSDWDGGDGVTVACGQVVAAPIFAARAVAEPAFKKLRGTRHAICDEPLDGLPADFAEINAEVRRRGWVR